MYVDFKFFQNTLTIILRKYITCTELRTFVLHYWCYNNRSCNIEFFLLLFEISEELYNISKFRKNFKEKINQFSHLGCQVFRFRSLTFQNCVLVM